MTYVDLALEKSSRHTDELYTYASEKELAVGQMVSVTFGKGRKPVRGFVFRTGVTPDFDPSRAKCIEGELDDFSLSEEAVSTITWMRQRYGITYADGIRCFIPAGNPPREGKEKRPYANCRKEEQNISDLTEEQAEAVTRIGTAIEEGKHRSFLIHGVTGSGKTEVYMQAIARTLALGRGAIMLVPEIGLTKQIIERFAGRFGKDKIAVLHSKLTKRERYDEWMRIYRGQATIVIGARLGVFAPVSNLGLIIMDEEHEATYKSDQTPKYETVDIAAKRLMYDDGVLVLGSATPSVVSYQRAMDGIYELIEMKRRYNDVPLPVVETVDMRQELRSGNRGIFSRRLTEEIARTLEERSQVILFLNRRGYSTVLTCRDCGENMKCPECGIGLVYHKQENAAVCHYCGRRFPLPETCPSCGSPDLRYFGAGTEKVEEVTQSMFPERKVERFDLDNVKNARDIDRILGSFARGKTDILIGTQLVAKGLDFRNVGLVGVVSADVGLNIPDYRSTERTFQLVSQVAGRAGRGKMRGRVIVQTYSPDNFALICAADHDYRGFFRQEAEIRRLMDYPPFADMIIADFTAGEEETARRQAERCRTYLAAAELPEADRIFQAQKTENFRGADASRWHIMIKCPKGERNKYIYYIRYFGELLVRDRIDCVLTIDVNPYSTY